MTEFEDLVDAHYQPLYRFGLSLAKSPDRASDLVQQTFVIWAEKGHQLKDRSKAKTWLFTTLYREFLSFSRRRTKFPETELSDAEHELPSHAPETDRQMDGQHAIELLGELEESFRAPLSLFYLQQHSYKEIAAILEVPIGTVMSRISRGKEQLRRRMVDEPSSAPRKIVNFKSDTLKKSNG